MNDQPRRGFALLVSVLAFSSILLTVAAAAAFALAGAERRGQQLEDLLAAQSLAEGCAESAIMSLRLDGAYAGNEQLAIAGSPCTIQPIVSGPPTVVETEATVNGSIYRLRVEISDVSKMTIASWRRVAAF